VVGTATTSVSPSTAARLPAAFLEEGLALATVFVGVVVVSVVVEVASSVSYAFIFGSGGS
jgi:hypothetical protein